MHEVERALVDGDVVLDGSALGGARAFAAAVKAAREEAHAPVHGDLKNGVPRVEDHGGNEDLTDGSEPDGVEVRDLA